MCKKQRMNTQKKASYGYIISQSGKLPGYHGNKSLTLTIFNYRALNFLEKQVLPYL